MSDAAPNPAEASATSPARSLAGRRVVLGVTASIAAYRSADLASALTKRGCEVHAVLTEEAVQFVSPLVLQTLTHQPVTVRLSEESANRPTHIVLADSADLIVVAPATANILAEHAHGLARDALGSILLATRAPILMAPAMNGKMWAHAATQANVVTLRSWGIDFIGPEEGMLACGYEGLGRMWNVPGIVERIEAHFCR